MIRLCIRAPFSKFVSISQRLSWIGCGYSTRSSDILIATVGLLSFNQRYEDCPYNLTPYPSGETFDRKNTVHVVVIVVHHSREVPGINFAAKNHYSESTNSMVTMLEHAVGRLNDCVTSAMML